MTLAVRAFLPSPAPDCRSRLVTFFPSYGCLHNSLFRLYLGICGLNYCIELPRLNALKEFFSPPALVSETVAGMNANLIGGSGKPNECLLRSSAGSFEGEPPISGRSGERQKRERTKPPAVTLLTRSPIKRAGDETLAAVRARFCSVAPMGSLPPRCPFRDDAIEMWSCCRGPLIHVAHGQRSFPLGARGNCGRLLCAGH